VIFGFFGNVSVNVQPRLNSVYVAATIILIEIKSGLGPTNRWNGTFTCLTFQNSWFTQWYHPCNCTVYATGSHLTVIPWVSGVEVEDLVSRGRRSTNRRHSTREHLRNLTNVKWWVSFLSIWGTDQHGTMITWTIKRMSMLHYNA